MTTLDNYNNIGPGAYSPNSNDSFAMGYKQVSKQTFGTSTRFNQTSKLNEIRAPGPGHYKKMSIGEES